MRALLFASLLAVGAFAGCGSDETKAPYVNALTGRACEPDPATLQPPPPKHDPPDHCVGTSNGDNCDDLHSGKIDCIGDGNSGQGDDKKHMCQFPQPGCDDQGCCDGDVVETPPEEPPPPPPPDEPPPPPPDPDQPIIP